MLLRLLVSSLPRRFPDLTLLLSPNDPETDFFNNIAHLQSHRWGACAESGYAGVLCECLWDGRRQRLLRRPGVNGGEGAFDITCMWVAKSHTLCTTVVSMGSEKGVQIIATGAGTHEARGTRMDAMAGDANNTLTQDVICYCTMKIKISEAICSRPSDWVDRRLGVPTHALHEQVLCHTHRLSNAAYG